jgi:hypothetical protein
LEAAFLRNLHYNAVFADEEKARAQALNAEAQRRRGAEKGFEEDGGEESEDSRSENVSYTRWCPPDVQI